MTAIRVAVHGIIVKNDRVLVTQRSRRNDYLPFTWDVPGGTAEPGESIQETLQREVSEETSLKIEILAPLFVYANSDQLPKRQTYQIVYLCRWVDGEVHLNPNEHDAFEWRKMSDLNDLPLIPFLESFTEAYSREGSSIAGIVEMMQHDAAVRVMLPDWRLS